MRLTQTGTSISGTVELSAPAGGVTIVTNAITGSIAGNAVTMTWTLAVRTPSGSNTITTTGTALFSLVATSSTAMSGTVASSVTAVCSGSASCPAPTTATSNYTVALAKR